VVRVDLKPHRELALLVYEVVGAEARHRLRQDHGGPTVQYAIRLFGRAVHRHRGDDPLLPEVSFTHRHPNY
jgi:hypothetical protein